MIGVVRVARGAVMRVEARHVDADLVHVGLADQQRARRAQAGHNGGILFGGSLAQEGRADRGGIGRLVQLILDRHGHTVEEAERIAFLEALGRLARHAQDLLAVDGDDGAQGRVGGVAGGDGIQHFFRHFLGRGFACAIGRGIFMDAGEAEAFALGWFVRPFLFGHRCSLGMHLPRVMDRGGRRRVVDVLLAQPIDARAFEQAGCEQSAQRPLDQ